MAEEDTYQAGVGRLQGANVFFCKETGIMRFFETDFTGAELKMLLLSPNTVTNYISNGSVLSLSQMSPRYGHALMSLAAGCSKASITLPAPLKGAVLVINFSGLVSNALVSVLLSGFSVVGLHGSDLSSFKASHGGQMQLVAAADDVWSVVSLTGSITENASA